MDPIAIAAILITTAACIYGVALLIYWPIAYIIRRRSDELEYQAMMREHAVYRSRPKDRVL